MNARKTAILFGTLAALLVSAPAMAAGPDYNSPGPYASVGFGGAWDFLEDIIEEEFPILGIEAGWSSNARVGYRVASWIGFEVMYEGTYGQAVTLDTAGILGDITTHGLYASIKLIAPLGRFNPYFLFGLGTQFGKWEGTAGILDTERWDFAIRPAFGMDIAITESWVLFGELGLPVRFADWTDIPSEVTDNVALTVGGGIQYRF